MPDIADENDDQIRAAQEFAEANIGMLREGGFLPVYDDDWNLITRAARIKMLDGAQVVLVTEDGHVYSRPVRNYRVAAKARDASWSRAQRDAHAALRAKYAGTPEYLLFGRPA